MTTVSEKKPIFDLYQPDKPPIGILSIPHSGMDRPSAFYSFLVDDEPKLNCDVDFGVHQLVDIQALNEAGIVVIKAHTHRTCVDLNRERSQSVLNWKKNSQGEPIVVQEPSPDVREELLGQFYDPYYEMFKVLISDLKEHNPLPVSFVDLHSMPSQATDYHLKQNPNQDRIRPDFCLSDQKGKTCTQEYIQTAAEFLAKDYVVKINDPYVGGYITQHVNAEFRDINNIQIEISRGLYMNESTIELIDAKVKPLRANLTEALVKLFEVFSRS